MYDIKIHLSHSWMQRVPKEIKINLRAKFNPLYTMSMVFICHKLVCTKSACQARSLQKNPMKPYIFKYCRRYGICQNWDVNEHNFIVMEMF